MSNARMQFDVNLGRAPRPARRPDDDDPMRILVVAPFGGATGRAPLAQSKPLRVDLDNLDEVFARIAPRLELALEGGPLPGAFDTLEDFHPDQLWRRLPPFEAMRALRGELQDPALYQRAAAALGVAAPAPEAPAAGAAADDTMQRLLGQRPAAAGPAQTPRSGIDDWLRAAMAPYIVPDTSHQQRALTEALDAAVAEQMRRVLHDPAFQALESAWLGVQRLVQGLELDETLQLHLLDATREELEADLQAHGDDLARSALFTRLCGSGAPDDRRWSLLVVDLAFGPDDADLRLLTVLGAMAAQAGAPLLAAAAPALLGATNSAALVDPQGWTEAAPLWQALRRSEVAPWIGLALPRLLARLPYGAQTDPVSAFRFEEMPAQRPHEAYLWGNPAYALALLAGQAFREDGWDMSLPAQTDVADLPSHVVQEDGASHQQPAAEWLLGERAGEAMLARGAMPLLSYRNRNAARLLRWQSIADPARALQGAWTQTG